MESIKSLVVCLGCQCVYSLSNTDQSSKMHENHNIITFDMFSKRFSDVTTKNGITETINKRRQYLEIKEQILMEFSVCLERYIEANLSTYQKIYEIFVKWQLGESKALEIHINTINQLWSNQNIQNETLNILGQLQEIKDKMKTLFDRLTVKELIPSLSRPVSQNIQIQKINTEQNDFVKRNTQLLQLVQIKRRDESAVLQKEEIHPKIKPEQFIDQNQTLMKYQFSPQVTYSEVRCLNLTKVRCNTRARLALIVPPVRMSDGFQKFGFKWGYCYGLCVREKVENNFWQIDESSTDQGVYMIHSSGSYYSKNRIDYKNTNRTFKFSKPTPVYIYVRPEARMIIFVNGETQKQFQLQYDEHDELYGCTYIGGGIETEVIQPDDVPDLPMIHNFQIK